MPRLDDVYDYDSGWSRFSQQYSNDINKVVDSWRKEGLSEKEIQERLSKQATGKERKKNRKG